VGQQRRDPEAHARQAVHLILDERPVIQHVSRRRHADRGRVTRVAIKQPGQAAATETKELVHDPQPDRRCPTRQHPKMILTYLQK
jgi:hypothetical protein